MGVTHKRWPTPTCCSVASSTLAQSIQSLLAQAAAELARSLPLPGWVFRVLTPRLLALPYENEVQLL